MGSRDKIVTLAIAGGILLALGVWTNHWWTSDGAVFRMGLREARVCASPMPCMSMPYGTVQQVIDHGGFFRLAKITYWIGLLGAALLFGHAYLASGKDERRVGWAAAAACAATVMLGIATIAARPADLGGIVSMSWSFPLAVVGAILGVGSAFPALIPTRAVAQARAKVGSVGDKIHRAAVGPVADLTAPPAAADIPEARVVSDAPEPTPDGPPVTAAYNDRLAAAKARTRHVAPRGGFMGKKERMAIGQYSGREVSADALKEALQFVAHRIEISEHGVHAYMRDGQQPQVAWTEVERAVMRRLPPDEPYTGLLMLDLLPRGATKPIRMLPSTHVNYGALPGGAGATSMENFKKLAAYLRDNNPSSSLDGTPPSFRTPREFLEYDAQYS